MAGTRTRLIGLVLLAAFWTAGVWMLVRLLRGYLGSAAFPHETTLPGVLDYDARRAVFDRWHLGYQSSLLLVIVLLALSCWVLVLLLAKRAHPRQCAGVVTVSGLVLLAGLLSVAAVVVPRPAPRWSTVPESLWALVVFSISFVVLSFVALRGSRTPMPGQYDRFTIGSHYTRFNKAGQTNVVERPLLSSEDVDDAIDWQTFEQGPHRPAD